MSGVVLHETSDDKLSANRQIRPRRKRPVRVKNLRGSIRHGSIPTSGDGRPPYRTQTTSMQPDIAASCSIVCSGTQYPCVQKEPGAVLGLGMGHRMLVSRCNAVCPLNLLDIKTRVPTAAVQSQGCIASMWEAQEPVWNQVKGKAVAVGAWRSKFLRTRGPSKNRHPGLGRCLNRWLYPDSKLRTKQIPTQ